MMGLGDEINSYDVERNYTGFNSMSFTSKTVEEVDSTIAEEGPYISMELKFDKLKNKDNLLALDKNGILTLEDKNVDYATGESLCDLLLKSGAQEIDKDDILKYGLRIIV